MNDTPPAGAEDTTRRRQDAVVESIRREVWALLVLYAALTILPLLLGAVIL